MALTPAQQAIVDRLKEYNSNPYNAQTNPRGFPYPGYITEIPRALTDTALTTEIVSGLADDVQAAQNYFVSHQVAVFNTDGTDIVRGDYIARLFAPVAGNISRFTAEILAGAGSCTVTPMIDGLAIADPVTLEAGTAYQDDSLVVAFSAGAQISFAIDDVENVSSVWAQLDGGA